VSSGSTALADRVRGDRTLVISSVRADHLISGLQFGHVRRHARSSAGGVSEPIFAVHLTCGRWARTIVRRVTIWFVFFAINPRGCRSGRTAAFGTTDFALRRGAPSPCRASPADAK
jgi:hypothetical protein